MPLVAYGATMCASVFGRALGIVAVMSTVWACQPDGGTVAPQPAATVALPDPEGKGGRLFDRFYREAAAPFAPGESGGPNGDGTLVNGAGMPISPDGHDYRLKNFFGWDLRGAEGIYGPDYQNKPYVTPTNLLTDSRSTEVLAQWLRDGDERIPAYGAVLSEEEIALVVTFIDGVRTGALPGPGQVFALSRTAPKHYVLNAGADLQAGHALFAEVCAECHGADGRKLPVDGNQSMGAFMRAKAYEGWFKILSGHPGSPMAREITFADAADGGAKILDLSAALCDATRYPAMEGGPDVEPGDARCRDYRP